MELLDYLDSLWNSKDVLDLTMPSKDEPKAVPVFMMQEDVTRPPEPTGIRRPGRRRTDSPRARASSVPARGSEQLDLLKQILLQTVNRVLLSGVKH